MRPVFRCTNHELHRDLEDAIKNQAERLFCNRLPQGNAQPGIDPLQKITSGTKTIRDQDRPNVIAVREIKLQAQDELPISPAMVNVSEKNAGWQLGESDITAMSMPP